MPINNENFITSINKYEENEMKKMMMMKKNDEGTYTSIYSFSIAIGWINKYANFRDELLS